MAVEGRKSKAKGLPSAQWNQRFRRRMLAWFRRNARELPWRGTRDPYAVWVSEIMLQQTQVVTVIDYYQRFMKRFPNVAALAAADEQDVLSMWEGLGYYRRARSMHQAAVKIMDEHDGHFPEDEASVRALPGIGRYTAGAVLSIARDQRLPILEANSIRVLSRLLGFRGDPGGKEGQRLLWDFAASILPQKHVGLFNQAVMELGSEICSPASPDCENCPAAALCHANELGCQEKIPAVKKKMKYEDVREAAVVVRHRGKVLLRRCGPNQRWAGLWDFPRFEVQSVRPSSLEKELCRKTKKLVGVEIDLGERLTTIKHGVTRFRITLACYEARCTKRNGKQDDVRWVRPNELDEYPLSVTGRKIGKLMQRLSSGKNSGK